LRKDRSDVILLMYMSNASSTVTSKWQVTLPAEVRSEFPIEIGQRISWEVENGKLVGSRIRSAAELAGCLAGPPGKGPAPKIKSAFGRAAIERERRRRAPRR
jgi:bifunctional DNA-binding transcriptional regulator/antitoxin component of YhaV-PrlF toxin-antitoxin module